MSVINILNISRFFVFILMFLTLCGADWGIDRLFIEGGASSNANSLVIGVDVNLQNKWLETKHSYIYNYISVSAGVWTYKSDSQNLKIFDYSVTPVFRYNIIHSGNLSIFTEAAIGIHLISSPYLKMDRKLGSDLLFGDHIGIGFSAGEKKKTEFTYRFKHLSNAGLGRQNEGINFHQIRIGIDL